MRPSAETERAERFAGRGASVLVIGSEQVFKHLAEQFGIERDFLFERSVFLDGELVAGQDLYEAADLCLSWSRSRAFVFLAVIVRKVHGAFRPEKEVVGQMAAVVIAVGEAVEDKVVLLLAGLVNGSVPTFYN